MPPVGTDPVWVGWLPVVVFGWSNVAVAEIDLRLVLEGTLFVCSWVAGSISSAAGGLFDSGHFADVLVVLAFVCAAHADNWCMFSICCIC